MSPRVSWCLALASLLPSLACAVPGLSDEPEADDVDERTPRELEGDKLGRYVGDCYNEVDPSVGRAVEAYARFREWTGELTNVRNPPNNLDPGVQPSTCRDAVTAAAAMPPSLPALEASAEGYAAALEALLPVLAEAQAYYGRGNHRDDDMAAGRALHPRLVASIEAYHGARRAFVAELDAVEARRTSERLAELEANPGQRGAFLVERFQSHGRALLDLNRAMLGALSSEGTLPVSLRASYLESASSLEAEHTELQGYEAGPGERLPSGFHHYTRQAEHLLRGQTRVYRYVRDHETLERRALGQNVDHAVDGFNDTVQAYNLLRFHD